MKLSKWAEKKGISYKTAFRLVSSGQFPGVVERLPTGTILVFDKEPAERLGVALYVRVSSVDQKDDAQRQLERLKSFCSAKGWPVAAEVVEVGSGSTGKRRELLKVLADATVGAVVVEHRDRLGRFGADMVEAALKAAGRSLVVLNESECKDGIVHDFTAIVTSMCARIYGRHSAKRRATKAIEAATR